jgi:hypothetical protein
MAKRSGNRCQGDCLFGLFCSVCRLPMGCAGEGVSRVPEFDVLGLWCGWQLQGVVRWIGNYESTHHGGLMLRAGDTDQVRAVVPEPDIAIRH